MGYLLLSIDTKPFCSAQMVALLNDKLLGFGCGVELYLFILLFFFY
jgi:hypothetical protein